ncbi:MAG: hypothetical protein JXB45_01765 [Candidatus Krumholzibacteriota bacterium]|nr:hypothetical protein [Candidatus Krumholzibacteriota bacterium]
MKSSPVHAKIKSDRSGGKTIYPGELIIASKIKIHLEHPGIAYLFLAALLVSNIYAFHLHHRASRFFNFDTVMVQDTAQIARNTSQGHFLITKYITPTSYAYFQTLENHPDYIRYPLPVLTYALLFSVFPDSPATLKVFNLVLFFTNFLILGAFFIALLRSNLERNHPRLHLELIAWASAFFSSITIFSYFRFGLCDAYDLMGITLLLLIARELFTKSRPWLLGILGALLYLCRANLGLLLPCLAAYLFLGERSAGRRWRSLSTFVSVVLLVLSPFFIRNLYYTGKPFFNLQQMVELNKSITGTHTSLYRNFEVPESITDSFSRKFPLLLKKMRSNFLLGFSFLVHSDFWSAWIGLPLFFWLFAKSRKKISIFLFFTLLHVFVISFFIQINRIYTPLYFFLSAIGYLGFISALSLAVPGIFKKGLSRSRLAVHIIVISGICLAAQTWGKNNYRIAFEVRVTPPSPAAYPLFKTHDIKYVYSNNPISVAWHADVISIYSPENMQEVYSKGPPECRHYFHDKRWKINIREQRFLRNHLTLIEEGELFALYEFKKLPPHFPSEAGPGKREGAVPGD